MRSFLCFLMPLLRAKASHFVSCFFGMGFSRGILVTGAGSVAYSVTHSLSNTYNRTHIRVLRGEFKQTVHQKLGVVSRDAEQIGFLVLLEFLRMSKLPPCARPTSMFTWWLSVASMLPIS